MGLKFTTDHVTDQCLRCTSDGGRETRGGCGHDTPDEGS